MENLLIGKNLVEIRSLTPEERDDLGWSVAESLHTVVLVLDDGTRLVPSADPEGNSGGTLFGVSSSGDSFLIVPPHRQPGS